MNNLRFSSGHPAFAIKVELAPSRREEMKNIMDNFQQGLRLCSPRLQSSMDDYSINYHCSLVTRSSAHFEISSGGDRTLKRSSSLDCARGLVAMKRSLSSPPALRGLFGFEGDMELILASPTKYFNHGTPLVTLSNLSTPRINFSTDDTDGSWTAGLQLVSNEDGSVMTEMHGTPIEHFHSGGGESRKYEINNTKQLIFLEMSPTTVPQSSVPTILDDSDQSGVPSSPLANEKTNERASLLDEFPIVVSPHLNNSVDPIEEQRRAAKLTRALEEPYEYDLQKRIMEEYEEQLTPMDNDNGFEFIDLSPTFPLHPTEDTNWEGSLLFQFENQVRLEIKSEDSPTELGFPELGFHGEGSTMTELPGDHFRIPEQVNMEAELSANIASNLNLLSNLVNTNEPDINGASFANGTVNQRNVALLGDSSAATESHFNNSMDSVKEKLCTANLVKLLEEPYEYNLQNRIMTEYELQLSPMDFTYEYASNLSTPTFLVHPKEDGNRKEQLIFQFPIQSQLEDSDDSNPIESLAQQLKELSKKSKRAVTPNLGVLHVRDLKPIDAESDGQLSIHARRLAARMVRQKERENEFNGQNRVMYEYEQMEPIDMTDDINYLCISPVYQGSQMVEFDFSSDSDVPESMHPFSSITFSSPLTEDSSYGNGDNSLPDDSQSTGSIPSYDFDVLTSLEEQLRFINLTKDEETGRVFFDQQRFVMEEFERNEPMDVRNGMSYKCLSPTFMKSSSARDIFTSFFTAQDSMDTKPTNNNECECFCEFVKDPEHTTHPLLPSTDYSAQSLDQCGRNRDEQPNDGREESPSQHFDDGFSDDCSQCAKDSGTYKNSSGIKQSYHEGAADPTGRGVGQQEDFQESAFLGLFDFPAALDASSSFDYEYEDDDEEEVFTEFNDQHLGSTQMEGGEDERFPHSQSSGLASCTRPPSEVDVFGSAPSAIERRVMSEFPGCSMEHARGMFDRRLHGKIARQLDSVDTCNQEETVMMEFEAGLGSGVCDDEDDGFSGEVEVDVENHEEDWNDETRGVCEAGTSQQSSLTYPLDSGGR
ncbi:hypothetical protein CAEBREN_01880 [Caenorhabditis brenneri]|uniref:Uncharacterized protein n=1 Tax=Caenorhabditis brenneri TaxID=135651 RepID=G0MD07_CAEBE|nr:hypothetical protein CAEBREN_01880 [Caenorhabditis brenneri]